MKCAFCNAFVPSVPAAIDADWIPSYWRGDEEVPDPVCPGCVAALLVTDDNGEFMLAKWEDGTPRHDHDKG